MVIRFDAGEIITAMVTPFNSKREIDFNKAESLTDYLVKNGLPFRDAHKVIGEIVAYCIENNKSIEEMTIVEFKQFSDLFENDIYDAISLETCVNLRNVTGGTSTWQVKRQCDL